LKQVALKAKEEMESAKSYVDISMLERYGFGREYVDLQNQERQGKTYLQDGNFQEALEIFGKVKQGYKGLDKQEISSRFKIEVVPSSIDFGTVQMGDKISRTITISNTGTAPVVIRSINIKLRAQSGQFGYRDVARTRIEPGKYCELSVTWEAGGMINGVGALDGYIVISLYDPASSEVRVPVVGRVTARRR